MKKINFIGLFVLLHCTNGENLRQQMSNILPVPTCMTLAQLLRATELLCHEHRQNKTLWGQVIKCHRPMTDEFMRTSGLALCPNLKNVQDPTNQKYSIEEVFFNICGVVDGNSSQIINTAKCIKLGAGRVASHLDEVKEVKSRWGQDLPCKIGKCVKGLGLNLGT